MTDIAIEWRDEQIDMLKTEVRRLTDELALALHRAEQAEERIRNLIEEVGECRSIAS